MEKVFDGQQKCDFLNDLKSFRWTFHPSDFVFISVNNLMNQKATQITQKQKIERCNFPKDFLNCNH